VFERRTGDEEKSNQVERNIVIEPKQASTHSQCLKNEGDKTATPFSQSRFFHFLKYFRTNWTLHK
jgi:hypothetical protein